MAAITWTGGDITGDSVVSTNGTSVFAISGSASTGGMYGSMESTLFKPPALMPAVSLNRNRLEVSR